jgi:bla regulator protein BlaR1
VVDCLIHATLSNFVVAFLLASVALVVQQRLRAPALAHLLWAIVLIKLITPPLFLIPVLELPNVANGIPLQNDKPAESASPISQESAFTEGHSIDLSESLSGAEATASESVFGAMMMPCIIIVIYSWAISSGILCFVSVLRIIRFHRLIASNSSIHEDLSSRLSAQVARSLGMRMHPKILVIRADIAPFVWWMAGQSVIVIPTRAVEELSPHDLRLVITHEMAHIKRRDHWLRWIEWIGVICMWWNPLMWWARSQLRASEEMACDDLVLETATAEPYLYGNALLNMAELLTTTAIRPPVVASAFNSGGSLEQRIKMMVTTKSRRIPRSVRFTIVSLAMCLFPLGVVYSQDLEAIKRRLNAAIEAGELSQDQAEIMIDALRRSRRTADVEAMQRRLSDIKTDLMAAVEAGEISKEDAEKKLDAVRREMSQRHERGDKAERERQLRDIQTDLMAAVEAGEISKEDAEKKLDAVRREMSQLHERGDKAERERQLRDIQTDLMAAVEAGEISKADAEKKLDAVRREMSQRHKRGGE